MLRLLPKRDGRESSPFSPQRSCPFRPSCMQRLLGWTMQESMVGSVWQVSKQPLSQQAKAIGICVERGISGRRLAAPDHLAAPDFSNNRSCSLVCNCVRVRVLSLYSQAGIHRLFSWEVSHHIAHTSPLHLIPAGVLLREDLLRMLVTLKAVGGDAITRRPIHELTGALFYLMARRREERGCDPTHEVSASRYALLGCPLKHCLEPVSTRALA
mgnify:CR=1 FL=1